MIYRVVIKSSHGPSVFRALIKLSLLFSGRFICDIDLFCFGEGSIVIFGFAEAVEDEEGRA